MAIGALCETLAWEPRRYDHPAAVRAILHCQGSAQGFDALAHADKPQTGAVSGSAQSTAVVGHLNGHMSVGIPPGIDLDQRRLTMSHGITEGFLNDAIDRFVEPITEGVGTKAGLEID